MRDIASGRRSAGSCSGEPAGGARPVAAGAPSRSTTSSSAPKGGSDFDLDHLVALCPPCHAQTDAPYACGRLVITPLGAGRFAIEVITGAAKWTLGAHPTVAAGPVLTPPRSH